MADNVAITAGSGTTISADDIGAGVLVQRVKATWGPDGSANDTDVATGKPMPIQIRSSTGTDMIKAGSTGAAAASDPALVVTIRDVNANGGASVANSAPVVPADQYSTHREVAAGQTASAIGAGGGATGDYLSHVTVFPGIAGCGVVTILDNAVTVGTFAGGGTTALPSLVPFMIPIGAFSTSGAWKITTGASVTVTAVGKFT